MSPESNHWHQIFTEVTESNTSSDEALKLFQRFESALEDVIRLSMTLLPNAPDHGDTFIKGNLAQVLQASSFCWEAAHRTSARLFHQYGEDKLIESLCPRPIRKIALVPATKIVLEHLDWFQHHFDEVLIADNFKSGETHFGQKVLSVEELMQQSATIDAFLLTTNTPDAANFYTEILPLEKTITIDQIHMAQSKLQFQRSGKARADRIIREIEQAGNPLVVVGTKMLATVEPTFAALQHAGYDVFALSLRDHLENQPLHGYDPKCPVERNAQISPYEQLYILTHLRKGRFWIYYDFFYNTAWDAANAMNTYAIAAAMLHLASRPVVLGMYDIIKPICLNMHRRHEAFAVYKIMLERATAVVLTSKSDNIAEYLRNTLVKDRPVFSFYRYSFPPKTPLKRLSDADGERHLVGVTSFLGEVFEPNRIETRNSIISILRQKIHFHYYSDAPKVAAFKDALSSEEQAYFHMEPAIWDQQRLIEDMSRYDGGWLVGDEATLFAKLIATVEDRNIRELYTLFVPNGVPTSSMAYGAAGLPVFISRQITIMNEVYPPGCCIPLDMGEVDNLANIFARLDWKLMHQTMREQRYRFDISHQIPLLAAFLNTVPQPESF